MKRNYLLIIALVLFGFTAKAQVDVTNTNKKAIIDNNVIPKQVKYGTTAKGAIDLQQIGMTNYDMQSNSSVARRIYYNEADGSMAATWIQYQGSTMPGSPTRGTGYNYFDGTEWVNGEGVATTVEGSTRTGWGNLAVTAGGKQVVISHGANDLVMASGSYGSTTWTVGNVPSSTDYTWPRTAVGGADGNTIHLITDITDASLAVVDFVYLKSEDQGVTWEQKAISDLTVPGGDSYAIDANGNTVAFVQFGDWDNTVLYKSTNNGETWTSKVIADFPKNAPYDLSDGPIIDADADNIADTLMVTDGCGSIVIDNNGVVHVTFGQMKVWDEEIETTGDPTSSYFPYTDGLIYWNDTMEEGEWTGGTTSPDYHNLYISSEADTIAFTPDLNNDSIWNVPTVEELAFGQYYISLSSMSNMAIDEENNIYVTYSTVYEGANYLAQDAYPNPQQYRHIEIIKSKDGGMTWSQPIKITGDEFPQSENVYCNIHREVIDGVLYFQYQTDSEPGCYMQEKYNNVYHTEELKDNLIISGGLLLGEFIFDNVVEKTNLNVSIYPNPAKDMVSLTNVEGCTIEIYNILGQIVLTQVATSALESVNISDLTTGSYIIRITNENGNVTSKQIVKY